MKRIYVILVLAFACDLHHAEAKSKKSSPNPEKSTETSPAIVAIQIVDPNENFTSTKHKKRTIDEALGYGYNSYGNQPGRFVTYKYSTHDIAPRKGPSLFSNSKYKSKIHDPSSPKIEITKSVEYKLPTVTEYIPPTAPAYTVGSKIEPGTTLFSTINTKGQLGDLSSVVPKNSVEYNDQPVPVIILRIYPQQLNDPQLFANLPKSNPYSSSINHINIQHLLVQYLKALERQNPHYQAPQQSYYSQSQTPYVKQSYKTQTQVSQKTHYQKTEAPVQQYYQKEQQPKTYQYYSQYPHYEQPQHGQAQQYQYQQQEYDQQYYKTHQQNMEPQYQQQEYYSQPQTYEQVDQVQYQQPDQVQYQQNQHYVPQDYVQPQYQPESAGGYGNPSELLTHENYPSDQHTKVVFRTKKGQIKTTQTEEPPRKEIKTINIEVPNNVAKIEVEESERPFLPTPPSDAQSYQYQQDDPQQNVYYQGYPQEYSRQQQQYYSAEQQTPIVEDSAETYQSQKVYNTRDAKPHAEIITNSDRGHVFNNYQKEHSNIQPEQNFGYNYYYQPTIQENQVSSDSKSNLEKENYYSNDSGGSNPNQGEYGYSASSTIRNPIVVAEENQQSAGIDQVGHSSTVSYNVVKRSRTKKRRVKIPSSSS